MRNATGAFEYRERDGRLVESPLALSRADTLLLITTAGYEIHAAAPISRSFINRLYNCAGKCVAGCKVSRATRHDERR